MFDLDTEIRLLNQSGDGRGRVRRDCDCRVPVPSWTREVEGRLAPSSAEQRVCRWSFRSATGSPTRKANGSSYAGTSAHTARPTCRSAERRDVSHLVTRRATRRMRTLSPDGSPRDQQVASQAVLE